MYKLDTFKSNVRETWRVIPVSGVSDRGEMHGVFKTVISWKRIY